MPALKDAPSPLEATQPSRRRIWPHPEIQSHSLLVLTAEQLHLAPLAGAPRPEIVAAAEFGADLDDLLGPLATVIDLSTVTRVRLDLLSDALSIEYSRGRAKSQITLTFGSPKSADACFSRIWRRLGERFHLQNPRNAWTLSRLPLTILGAVFAVTALLALTITTIDDMAPVHAAASVNVPGDEHLGGPVLLPPSVKSAIGWMDWRVVCALGGAAAAATQVWLYRRITQPPAALEVMRI
ncbi:MAG TPA: hypothetical protein VGL71_06115 [Urbifossiella sp.]|jgi:hypothetical protein